VPAPAEINRQNNQPHWSTPQLLMGSQQPKHQNFRSSKSSSYAAAGGVQLHPMRRPSPNAPLAADPILRPSPVPGHPRRMPGTGNRTDWTRRVLRPASGEGLAHDGGFGGGAERGGWWWRWWRGCGEFGGGGGNSQFPLPLPFLGCVSSRRPASPLSFSRLFFRTIVSLILKSFYFSNYL
jgi:hypothetical protein